MAGDVVVVGSGVAGMTAAISLAKAGLRVLVLEQALAAGGLMRSYVRSGLRFPIGVHSVGAVAGGQVLRQCFERLGVFERLRLVPMDREGFEEYRFPGFGFSVPVGHERFRERLGAAFWGERAAIDRFLGDMNRAVGYFPRYAPGRGKPAGPLPPWLMRPLAGYLDGLTGSRELKAVLAAGNPRYGLPPSQCPTYLHLLVLDSYLQSSWRVDEAHCPLAIAFEAALLEAGGQLRCGARIAAIECPGGRVRGVRLADGERIPAATVVFTGDPRQLPVLCGGELRPAYLSHLAGAGATPGAFVSAVAWEGSSCPAADRDIYVYDTWDMEEVYGRDRHLSQDGPPRMVYFAASDRGADGAFPMTALCLADGGEWAPWAGSRVGSRPDGYGQAKREMAGRLLSVLRSQWPNEARLRVVDSFSPLTIANYTLSVAGSCYGLPPERLTAAARVVGLHLAGQSVHGPGIIGATLGALEACGRILEERLGSQVAMGWAARTLGPCLAR